MGKILNPAAECRWHRGAIIASRAVRDTIPQEAPALAQHIISRFRRSPATAACSRCMLGQQCDPSRKVPAPAAQGPHDNRNGRLLSESAVLCSPLAGLVHLHLSLFCHRAPHHCACRRESSWLKAAACRCACPQGR